jgi:hypothetical protein
LRWRSTVVTPNVTLPSSKMLVGSGTAVTSPGRLAVNWARQGAAFVIEQIDCVGPIGYSHIDRRVGRTGWPRADTGVTRAIDEQPNAIIVRDPPAMV